MSPGLLPSDSISAETIVREYAAQVGFHTLPVIESDCRRLRSFVSWVPAELYNSRSVQRGFGTPGRAPTFRALASGRQLLQAVTGYRVTTGANGLSSQSSYGSSSGLRPTKSGSGVVTNRTARILSLQSRTALQTRCIPSMTRPC